MLRVAVLAVAVAVLAGCSSSEEPGKSEQSPTTAPTQTGKAPPITAPELDLAGYADKVCELLSPAQVKSFRVDTPGRAGDHGDGPLCSWHTPEVTPIADFTVTLRSESEDAWEVAYNLSEEPFFEEAGEVNGYPAVHLTGPKGFCSTVVGVTTRLVFEVEMFVNGSDTPGYDEPCSLSDQIASRVIDTLKR